MDKVQQRVLIVITATAALLGAADPPALHFYPDDPLWKMPPPLPLKNVDSRKINQLYDFVINSVATPGEHFNQPGQAAIRAQNINTVDEVPDSQWYTNRHYRHPMSLDELRRGPDRGNEPVPPFTVVASKSEGVTPGFQIVDAKKRRYLCKPDPLTNPEMATAADVIGSKFFYALGYYTPENYIIYFTRSELSISPKAKITPAGGRERPMNEGDLARVLRQVPRDRENRYRMMASLFVPGKGIGPFEWFGTRPDDPNDIYRHEHHRELRGLYVFCAWLNHTDIKAGNTYDTVIEENGQPVIRHYLIDFGSMLGSDSSWAKDARFGHEYMLEKDKLVLLKMFDLGLYSPDWERAHYPGIPAVGRFEAATFHPDEWTSNYPNAAFMNRLPDDTFWAAKQVMAFTTAQIRAMVETGRFSDARAPAYITETLFERQQKIGRTFFSQVLPLDKFSVENGDLRFQDLAVNYGFVPPRQYEAHWFRFNNNTGTRSPLNDMGLRVPRAGGGEIVGAEISSPNEGNKKVYVYLRGNTVIGVERTW